MPPRCIPFRRRSVGHGVALSWALYCSLLRLKDRRIPANGFVAVSSLLGALILLPIVIFWLMRHPAQDWAAWREPFSSAAWRIW